VAIAQSKTQRPSGGAGSSGSGSARLRDSIAPVSPGLSVQDWMDLSAVAHCEDQLLLRLSACRCVFVGN
jgi:hypothetical protein